jgi:multidrug efflux pump subunit AcrA (membrane-fusion protein)
MRAVISCCAGFWLLGACTKHPAVEAPGDAAAPNVQPAVAALQPDEIKNIGIAVNAAVPMQHTPETLGFGVVAAHEPIAQAVADWATAAAMELQSRAALARVQRLAGTPGALPADIGESAERQAAVDTAALLLARRRLTAAFGQNPPWKDDIDSPLLRASAGGEMKLVRVTFPLGSLRATLPVRLRLARMSATPASEMWTAAAVWVAPADANVPGTSFFALLRNGDAGEGERLLVWAASGYPASGVLIPAAAAVISDGRVWCFIERRPGVFVRTALDTSTPVEGGYFVKSGFAPGDRLVTAGAGLLLAREKNPAPAAE